MSSLADKLRAAAEAAAVEEATRTNVPDHVPIDEAIVSDPVVGPRGIAVRVRVVMKDGTGHCYEYRSDTKGEYGRLVPVAC